jgi:hypothetical protein
MPTAAHSAVEVLAAPPLAGPGAGAATAAAADGAGMRVLAAVLCAALAALPFLEVRFPPITDLPQHTAQIRLFLAAFGDPEGAYRIQWFTPYSAAYALLGAAWALSTPANAGRLAVLALTVLWVLAVHGLAACRKRSVAAAGLATVLIFNHTLYWGFLSFSVGGLAFIVWLLVTARPPRARSARRDALLQFGAALLLYVSHALWFGFGVAWLVLYAAVHRWPWRVARWRLGGVAPVAAGAALWYPHLEALGFVSPTVWFTPPPARLAPQWIVDAMLGGIYGPTEYLIVAVVLAWIVVGLWQQRRRLADAVDPDLLGTGALLIALGLLLPDQHANTIQFAARWVPLGAMLVVLGVPAPSVLAALQRPLALALVAVFCLGTALAWMAYERDDLSGLATALAAVPDDQRVLGLDLVQESRTIKGRPFLQTFAYAQVLHGGRLNVSFAGFAPSLVVYRQRRPLQWTRNLDWFAERVRPRDFRHFDYALINGSAEVHAQATELPLVAVTDAGRWRLYRVAAPAR